MALGPTVYLWNASSGSVEELCTAKNEGDYITSVSWAADSTHIAIGTSDAKVQVSRDAGLTGVVLPAHPPQAVLLHTAHRQLQACPTNTPPQECAFCMLQVMNVPMLLC